MIEIKQKNPWPRRIVRILFLFALIAVVTYILIQRQQNTPPAPVTQSSVLTPSTVDLPERVVDDKSSDEKDTYTVPAAHPRQLSIEKLGIKANVLSLGLTADGAMAAPETAWDVGWYNQSSFPADDSGAILIDGHVNNTIGTPGVFYELDTLKEGDLMVLESGDGSLATFKVVGVEQTPTEEVDMARMMRSAEEGELGLNLITCGGAYDHAQRTFLDRVLVFTVRVS